MYTEAELEAARREERRATAEAVAKHFVGLVRDEVERVSRRRLNTRQAATYLSVGRRALREYADAGRIPYEDRGGSVGYVFDRDDLDALAADLARS